MFFIKNMLVLGLGFIQMIIGGLWFGAFLVDYFGQSGSSLMPRVNGSIYLLFGAILLLGSVNLYLGIINLLHILIQTEKKYPNSFSIALLTLIGTIFLLLAIRSVLALSNVSGF